MINKDRMLTLLGSGLGPQEVATTLGCDQSYVSQQLMDEDFKALVLARRVEHLQAATERDKKINSIEDDLIQKLQDSIPYMLKSDQILRAFHVVNRAARRGASQGAAINITQNVVQLNLPPAARKLFTTSHTGEVVEVDSRSTSTKSLGELMRERAHGSANSPGGKPESKGHERSREVEIIADGFPTPGVDETVTPDRGRFTSRKWKTSSSGGD
jgi:hypothetical protein